MPLVIKENEAHFEVAPPGLHQAVCVDVIDLGMVDGKFGPKRKLKLVFQLKSKNKVGERFQARASYTQSLFEGSNLRRDLESWRGRAFTDEERKAFDVERLIGKNCQLSLKHGISRSTGRTYGQITVILPPVKGADMKPENYTREPWPTEKTEAAHEAGAARARAEANARDIARVEAEPVYDVEPIDEGHAAAFDSDDCPF